jgi:hypothetical protein
MDDPSKDHLHGCIRANLECADLCFAAATLASQPEKINLGQLITALERAAQSCQICAEECQRHANRLNSCVDSAEACHNCREAVMLALQDVGGATGVIQTN